jgi:lipoprotein-releasing system ATP-binding protein
MVATVAPVLQAYGLTKRFDFPKPLEILRGIDLTVQRGETVAIMGRSGEGKTTLLHTLGTLEAASSGSLEIAGLSVSYRTTNRIRNRHIAFVFQSFHLLENESALANILMPARIARRDVSRRSAAYGSAIALLERIGLEARMNFPVQLLSGGEKQRIAIARALCNDPDVLFADEPSGNLDAETSAVIHALLIDFVKEGNKALVVVTHDKELAQLCDTQYYLHQGRLHPSLPEVFLCSPQKE